MRSLLHLLQDDSPQIEEDILSPSISKEDILSEISMILTSRPYSGRRELTGNIAGTVLNFGVNTLIPDELPAENHSEWIKRRINEALNYFEPRLRDVVVNYSAITHHSGFFNIKGQTDIGPMNFEIFWEAIPGSLTLDVTKNIMTC